MRRVCLVGLLKVGLPDHTVLLTDGGFLSFDGETYLGKDPRFGTIGSIEGMEEGAQEAVPALELGFSPPSSAAIADLSRPGYQNARVRLWLGEKDIDTGLLVTVPELQFDGQVDQTVLSFGDKERDLDVTVVSTAERLFEGNIGNSMSSTFHKSVWPGELGHDNATGLSIPVAWGAETPPGAYGGNYSGGGGGRTGPRMGIGGRRWDF